MTDNSFPLVPPPELVQQWTSEFYGTIIGHGEASISIANQAARWGADQELEACCEWLGMCKPHQVLASVLVDLRAARRPKSLSLKAQALEILGYPKDFWNEDEVDTIRRALEALSDD